MRKVRILGQAAEEAEAAAGWYEKERDGLGAEFAEAIDAALDMIEEFSFPCPLCRGNPAPKEQNASFFAASPTTSLLSKVEQNWLSWPLLIILESLDIGEIELAPNAGVQLRLRLTGLCR